MEKIFIHLLVLVFSVVVHEYAHGMAAYRLGDNTAALHGRLTLNPLNHIDLVGSILVPVVLFITGGMMFGWAKPVPVRVGHLNNPKNDHPKVAAAGPVANLMLALISAVGLGLTAVVGEKMGQAGNMDVLAVNSPVTFFLQLFQTGILLNVLLALFNLVPLPPLDGSWVMTRFLPTGARLHYEKLRSYGFLPVIAFLVLMQVSPIGTFFQGIVRTVYGVFVNITLAILGLAT